MSKKDEDFLNGTYAEYGKLDGDVFIYDHEGPRLFMSLPFSNAEHIAEISSGEVELALFEHGPVLFILFRFGGGFWADAPFNINLNAARNQLLSEESDVLRIRYYDSTKEKIVAEREVQLPAAFSTHLHASVARQLQNATSIEEFVNTMRDAYTEYNEPWQMVAWTSASCHIAAKWCG